MRKKNENGLLFILLPKPGRCQDFRKFSTISFSSSFGPEAKTILNPLPNYLNSKYCTQQQTTCNATAFSFLVGAHAVSHFFPIKVIDSVS